MISKKLGDYWVFPSSIHECMIIKHEKEASGAYYSEMVKEINQEHVSEDEFLSNNVYFYNSKTKEISIMGGD